MAIFVSKDSTAETSENSTPAIEYGDPAGFAGYAGSPAGSSNTSSDTQPPIANRGAEITIPPDNRSLLDWVSFTLKLNDPSEVLELISLDPLLFTEFQYGFSGYRKSLCFDNISIYYNGREDMGCHVEMSGQGCRQFEAQFTENPWQELFDKVLQANGNFKRLDLAIDNVDGALSLDRIYGVLKDHERQVRTLFSEWQRILKGSFHEGETVTGETIYLGSKKSHVMFRIYDKCQSALNFDPHRRPILTPPASQFCQHSWF